MNAAPGSGPGSQDQAINVVIGANSLSGPLTGIGHYTINLIEGLSQISEIDEIRLLSHGCLSQPLQEGTSAPAISNMEDSHRQPPITGRSLLGALRVKAAGNRLIVNLYDAAISRVSAWSLRGFGSTDIFHSPDFQYATFPGKTVVTIPDLSTMTYPEFHPASRVGYINRHIRRAVSHADHIVAISDFVRGEIISRLKVEKERVTTIYPGVEPGFAPITEQAFVEARPISELRFNNYFLFVSTIEPRKNISRLLEAYERYIEAEGETRLPLVVVGFPGWNSSAVHHELQRLARCGHVMYPGYVSRDALRTLLAGARALLFPSLYEGFGLPVAEAMRSATAVLTSQDSAMAEISGGAALLVDPLDIEGLVNGISRLHHDEALLEKMVESGLIIGNRYSWERCARETLDLYRFLQVKS